MLILIVVRHIMINFIVNINNKMTNLNSLFNHEWFIQTLIETIICDHKFTFSYLDQKEKPELVCNIFQLNRKCYFFSVKHSFFLLKAHDNYFELKDQDQIEVDENGWVKKWKPTIYNKKYMFNSRAELDENLQEIIKENNFKTSSGEWFVEFSCYRYYRMRDGSKRRIKVLFRCANLCNHKDLYNVFTDSDEDV